MKRYFYYIAFVKDVENDQKEHIIHGVADFDHKTARLKYAAVSKHLMREYKVPFSNVAILSLDEIDKEDWETLQAIKKDGD